ncbi:bifunctional 4-hydroxy-2-oxoglutarate aldolase/2-dehydro-3-deoxy-phosphogluconate aldolase [Gordonia sp. NPDC003424]
MPAMTLAEADPRTVGVTSILDRIGLLPVIVVDDIATAGPLADALVDSGLHTAEVTFRTPAAAEALSVFAQRSDLLVGAGTVRTVEQVDLAHANGAEFVVSPGFSDPVVARCREIDLPVLPGVASATDIHRATEAGCTVLKFFPAEASGGVPAITALTAPFPDVRFVPTGGVGPANLADYLSIPAVGCVGGSWMVPRDVVRVGDWSRIGRLCREAVAQVLESRA